MSKLSDKIGASPTASSITTRRTTPVWRGPEEDGITFSLLSRFLCCRERFRLLVVEGLRPADQFNHRLEYGNMWHTCEEADAKQQTSDDGYGRDDWQGPLTKYCQSLCRKYPLQQEQVDHWYNVCKVQFPLYVDFWSRHRDTMGRTPLLQEKVFCVPYRLPSARTVKLRGKWDSIDLVDGGIWLQENKTRGDIREGQIQRQLTFDLQTMMYLVALDHFDLASITEPLGLRVNLPNPIIGVRYNVVRRPLSGGKGTIVRHKPSKSNPQGESKEAYYARLAEYIREEPETYFMRWNVAVSQQDVSKFRRECLDSILEQLCDWWDEVTGQPVRANPPMHWRHPFGVWNALDEGGSSDLDTYLETGSEVGLRRADNLFEELG